MKNLEFKEALSFKSLEEKRVRCDVCQRHCVIPEGQTGFCLTKLNRNGKLYTLNYGIIHGIQVEPIEKKPFYHFLPGEMVPSIGSYGCNYHCKQCLNWWCSWGEPASSTLKEARIIRSTPLPPEKVIEEIKKGGYKGIAFTYNEPTVWAEYVLDVARLAKKEGFYTVYVTNGSWTKETLDKIGPYIDAANVDLKGFSQETYTKMGAFFDQMPEALVYAQEKHHIFIEITTLLIPGINDNPQELSRMSKWIVKNLSPETPWHLSQYDPTAAPDPEFQKIPFTTPEQLNKAARIGQKEGLKHIYIWAPSANYSQSDTFCPKCQKIVIKRSDWEPVEINITPEEKCRFCGYRLRVITRILPSTGQN